jgi:hypothetical protein
LGKLGDTLTPCHPVTIHLPLATGAQASRSGCRFISKPTTPTEVLLKIRQVLDASHSRT